VKIPGRSQQRAPKYDHQG